MTFLSSFALYALCFVLANFACLPICTISRSGKQTQIGAKLCRNWIESYRNYRRQWRCHVRGASVSVSNSNSTLTFFPPLSALCGLPKRLTSWGYCNCSRLCKKDHRCQVGGFHLLVVLVIIECAILDHNSNTLNVSKQLKRNKLLPRSVVRSFPFAGQSLSTLSSWQFRLEAHN